MNLHCPIEMRLFKYLQEINRENVFKMGGKVEHLKNRKQGLKPDPSRASCLNAYLPQHLEIYADIPMLISR